MRPKGVRGSSSGEAREEIEGVEGKIRQDLQADVSDFRMQSESGSPRLFEGLC